MTTAEIISRVEVADWNEGNCETCGEWRARTTDTDIDECAPCAVIGRGLTTPEETMHLQDEYAG